MVQLGSTMQVFLRETNDHFVVILADLEKPRPP